MENNTISTSMGAISTESVADILVAVADKLRESKPDNADALVTLDEIDRALSDVESSASESYDRAEQAASYAGEAMDRAGEAQSQVEDARSAVQSLRESLDA